MESTCVTVKTGVEYDVHIAGGIIDQLGSMIAELPADYKKVAVVTDETVKGLYGDVVEQSLLEVGYEVLFFTYPGGESYKTMDTVMDIVCFLLENGFTRTDLIVALGGGVVGDMAGFAASIALRGIDFVQVPTTLLAAVDSSVGGKTGVNTAFGKNMVGSFYQPKLVVCDTDIMLMLPREIFADGMAEVIKYAAIQDAELMELLPPEHLYENLSLVIARCVAIKADVVAQDEHDHAWRNILNFGHTLGHAVEKLSGYTLAHGKGVAIGMCLICAASEAHGLTEYGTAQAIADLLQKWNLPTTSPYGIDPIALACRGDKKSMGASIRLVLLDEIGKVKLHKVELSRLAEFLHKDQGVELWMQEYHPAG